MIFYLQVWNHFLQCTLQWCCRPNPDWRRLAKTLRYPLFRKMISNQYCDRNTNHLVTEVQLIQSRVEFRLSYSHVLFLDYGELVLPRWSNTEHKPVAQRIRTQEWLKGCDRVHTCWINVHLFTGGELCTVHVVPHTGARSTLSSGSGSTDTF